MSKRKRRKRTWVILGAFLFLVLLFSLTTAIYVRLRYPPEEVGRRVASLLSDRLRRPVHIGGTSFHLLRGFVIDSLRIGMPFVGTSALDSLLVGRVELRYDPRALLHRKIHIRSVKLQEPELFASFREGEERESFARSRRATIVETGKHGGLPLALEVSSVEVTDAVIAVMAEAERYRVRVRSPGWTLRTKGWRLERGSKATASRLPQVEVTCGAPVVVAVQSGGLELTAESRWTFALRFAPDSMRGGRLQLGWAADELELREVSPGSPRLLRVPRLFRTTLDGQVLLSDTAFALRSRSLELSVLGSEPAGGLLSWVSRNEGGPVVRVRFEDLQLPADELLRLVMGWRPELRGNLKPTGIEETSLRLSVAELRRWGSPDTTELTLLCEVEAERLGEEVRRFALDSLSLGLEASLSALGGRLDWLEVTATAVAQSCSLTVRGKPQVLRLLTFDAGAALDSTLWPRRAHAHLEVQRGFGAFFYGESDWETAGSRQSLRGKAELQVHHLRLASLLDLPATGRFDFRGTVYVPGDGTIRVQSRWAVDSVLVLRPLEPVLLAAQEGIFEGVGTFDPETGRVDLAAWDFTLGDALASHGQMKAAPGVLQLRVDTAAIRVGPLYSWLQPLLPEEMREIVLAGELGLRGALEKTPGGSTVQGRLAIAQGLFSRPSSGFAAGAMDFLGDFEGNLRTVSLSGAGVVDSLWLENLGRREIRDTQVRVRMRYDRGMARLSLDSVRIWNPSLQLRARAEGVVETKVPDTLAARIRYSFEADPKRFAWVGDRLALLGSTHGSGLMQLIGDRLRIAGTVKLEGTDFRFPGEIQIEDTYGVVGFDYWVDRSGSEPIFLPSGDDTTELALHLASAEDFRWEPLFRPRYDTLFVRSLKAGGYRLGPLRAHVFARDGVVLVPYFEVRAYDGSIGGGFLYDMRNSTSRGGALEVDVQLARLNSGALLGRRAERAALLTASVYVRGKGMELEDLPGYQGWLEFTRIGRRVADDLLRSLDPQGANRGIQNTRRLLSLGFRPRRMRFVLRDGYFYPDIVLEQPWFSPVKLSGGRIAMGRIPIRMFLGRARALAAR